VLLTLRAKIRNNPQRGVKMNFLVVLQILLSAYFAYEGMELARLSYNETRDLAMASFLGVGFLLVRFGAYRKILQSRLVEIAAELVILAAGYIVALGICSDRIRDAAIQGDAHPSTLFAYSYWMATNPRCITTQTFLCVWSCYILAQLIYIVLASVIKSTQPERTGAVGPIT
jgi:hypothetical protein